MHSTDWMYSDATNIWRWVWYETIRTRTDHTMRNHFALSVRSTSRITLAQISALILDASRHRGTFLIVTTPSSANATFADFSETLAVVATLRETKARKAFLGKSTIVVRSARKFATVVHATLAGTTVT